jgi:hypothetical protein
MEYLSCFSLRIILLACKSASNNCSQKCTFHHLTGTQNPGFSIERPIVCRRSLIRLAFEHNIVYLLNYWDTYDLSPWNLELSNKEQKWTTKDIKGALLESWQPFRNTSKLILTAIFQRQGCITVLCLLPQITLVLHNLYSFWGKLTIVSRQNTIIHFP